MNFKKCYERIEAEKKFLGRLFDNNFNYPLAYLRNTEQLLFLIQNLKKNYKLSRSQKKYLDEFVNHATQLLQKINQYSYYINFYDFTAKGYLRMLAREEIDDLMKFVNKRFNKKSFISGWVLAELKAETFNIPLEPKKEGILKRLQKTVSNRTKQVKTFYHQHVKRNLKKLAPVALSFSIMGIFGYGCSKFTSAKENETTTFYTASSSNAYQDLTLSSTCIARKDTSAEKSLFASMNQANIFETDSFEENLASSSNLQRFETKEELIMMKKFLFAIRNYGVVVLDRVANENLQEKSHTEVQNMDSEVIVDENLETKNIIGSTVNVLENASIYPDVESVVYQKNGKKSTYGDKVERIIESVILVKDNDIKNVKTMEDYNLFIGEDYEVKGYTLLNQYSVSNSGELVIEGRFEKDDVALVRK